MIRYYYDIIPNIYIIIYIDKILLPKTTASSDNKSLPKTILGKIELLNLNHQIFELNTAKSLTI